MDHVERFHATIERQSIDRPCTWMGLVNAVDGAGLLQYYGAGDVSELITTLDDDVAAVPVPYRVEPIL